MRTGLTCCPPGGRVCLPRFLLWVSTWPGEQIRSTPHAAYDIAGTFLGSIFQAFLADLDFFGRKGSIFSWAMLFNIGCAVQVSSHSYGQLLAGRLIAGLGECAWCAAEWLQ